MIKLNNVRKAYNDKEILNGINYIFDENKCYYIRGKSGEGKTTLLNLIYGYEACDSGHISLDIDRIEYMFQDILLFGNLSIKENLLIKCNASSQYSVCSDEELKKVLQKVNLECSLEKKVSTLSGGEQQRLQLAQYILATPKIILFDEPACKLDITNRENIYNLINDIFDTATRIIITHDEEIVDREGIKLELRGGKLWEE